MTVEAARLLWLLVAVLGLALPAARAGLPVLSQGAFVAVGAFGTALLGPGGAGLPLGVAVVLAVALAAATGQLVALGAGRLEGAGFALATWALAWLVHEVLLALPAASGGAQGRVLPAPPRLVSPSVGLEVVLAPAAHVVLAAATCALLVAALRRAERGPGGLDLVALGTGVGVASSLGVPVGRRRRSLVTVAAACGGLSGAGTALLLGVVAPADVSPLLSVQLLLAAVVGGRRWWGPLVGVALLGLLAPVAETAATAAGLDAQRLTGLLTALLLAAVLVVRRLLATAERAPAGPAPALADVEPAAPPEWRPVLLAARDVRLSYGGVRALDGVDLELRAGEVHGLLGPNGSGKSSLLAVLAGAREPDAGEVLVAGAAVGRGERARVLAGVVRTPQDTDVLPGATVRQQVAAGARGAAARPAAVLRHLLATPGAAAAARADDRVVDGALAVTGLAPVAGADPQALPHGYRRLLQVARAAATGAGVVLLDEPAAGCTAEERRAVARAVRALAGNGVAVLLVEHDVRLVSAVADRVTVLDAGRVLASGSAADVRADPAVRRAYLGEVPA